MMYGKSKYHFILDFATKFRGEHERKSAGFIAILSFVDHHLINESAEWILNTFYEIL